MRVYADDDFAGANRHFFAPVVVRNVAPVITAASLDQNAMDEGETVTLNASFTDPGWADTHEVVIDWGDGSQETLQIAANVRAFTAAETANALELTVRNVAPILTAVGSLIREGDVATVSGTITDPGAGDTFEMVIDWGEGDPQAYRYAAGTTSYSETHRYGDDDPTGTPLDDYTIGISIRDDDTGSGSAVATVTVENVAPVVTAFGSVIDENGVAALSGRIDDPSKRDPFELVIDWDEGSPQTYRYPAGTTSFEETHQYLDDDPTATPTDEYTIQLEIRDDDQGIGTDSTVNTIHNVDPVATIDRFADETGAVIGRDVPVALVGLRVDATGSYTDVGSLDTHTAVFDWGDGEASDLGEVFATASASHVYVFDQDTTVTLTVTDDDTGDNAPEAELAVASAARACGLYAIGLLARDGGERAAKWLDKACDKLRKDNINAAFVRLDEALALFEIGDELLLLEDWAVAAEAYKESARLVAGLAKAFLLQLPGNPDME